MKIGGRKFKISGFFSLVILLLVVFNIKMVQAVQVIPSVVYAGIDHSPIVEGDKASFYISSNYDKNVQYKAFLYSETTGKWQELTKGYSDAIEGKKIFEIKVDKAFMKGAYKLVVHIKKEESKAKYDSFYVTKINCVNKDDKTRVYVDGSMNINKNNYILGETINIKGIENIKGMKAPYKYKLHVYDVLNNTWIKDITGWEETVQWMPEKAGVYVVDLWAKSENSKSKYEGWKLKIVTVSEDKPIAKVNSEEIMQSEINKKMISVYDIVRERFGEDYLLNRDAKVFIEGEQKEILNSLIDRKIVFQKGKILSVIPNNEEMKLEVNKRFNDLKLQYDNLNEDEKYLAKDFETYLQVIGYDEASCKEDLEVSVILDRIYDLVIKDAVLDVTEEMVQAYYNENKYEFTEKPCSLEASHILVATEKEAISLKKQLDEGKDFAKLAQEKGTDGTKDNGGYLGVINYADKTYDKDFMEGAIATPEGKISDPVKTQFGYHIIKIIKKNEYDVKKLEEVKEDIKNKLILDKKQKFYEQYQEEWFKSVVIERY